MAEVTARSHINFETLRIVLAKVVDRAVGLFDKNPARGWRFDERHLVSFYTPETLPNPGLRSSSLRQIPLSYWANGPTILNHALEVTSVIETRIDEKVIWSPIIKTGEVSIHRDTAPVFSDDSVVKYIDPDNIDNNRHYHLLENRISPDSPILAVIYTRSDMGEYLPWRNYQLRNNFTGLLDDTEEEMITSEQGTILWDNIDFTKREFIAFQDSEARTILMFNQNVIEEITTLDDPTTFDDFNDMEYLGEGDGSTKVLYETKFFPLLNDIYLEIYLVDTVSIITPTLITSGTPTIGEVLVDLDLGLVKFGEPPELGTAVYLRYRTTPRIEYEPEINSGVLTGWSADVNPKNQSLNRGFVVFSKARDEVATLTLETTVSPYPLLSGEEAFGPISVGSGYAPLIATAYTSTGEVVPNIEVTFSIISSPPFGTLAGVRIRTQAITDAFGEAHSFYSPPNSASGMGVYSSVVSTSHLYVSGMGPIEDLNNVYTYMVLKDDPFLGKINADTTIGEVPWEADPPNGRKVVLYQWDANAINPVTGFSGAYSPIRPISYSSVNGVFDYASNLDIPNTADSTINLGAYWVVADRVVTIQASCLSPRTGTTIYSNTLILRVELPNYMKGEYISDTLQKIPFGWRILDNNYNVAATLDGATFITINPIAGPYPIVDVIGGETLDWPTFWPNGSYPYYGYYPTESDYVSAPFGVLSLYVELNS